MTIAEVSKMYGLTPATLRYYERVGVIPAVDRKNGGVRVYTEESCKWIELAKTMREAGVSIDALVEYCALEKEGNGTVEQRRKILEKERDRIQQKLEEEKVLLKRLDFTINHYVCA